MGSNQLKRTYRIIVNQDTYNYLTENDNQLLHSFLHAFKNIKYIGFIKIENNSKNVNEEKLIDKTNYYLLFTTMLNVELSVKYFSLLIEYRVALMKGITPS